MTEILIDLYNNFRYAVLVPFSNIMISRTIESFENKRVHKMYKCLPVLGKKTLFIPYILHV